MWNTINNSFQYRMFLTHNANKLMNLNKVYTCQKNCCGPCQKPYNKGTMLPESTMVTCNKFSCSTSVNDSQGLGQGRNYGNDNNCASWPELPTNQPFNCCSDTKNLFNYYDDVKGESPRLTVQGGGLAMSGGDPKAYNH